VLNSTTDALEKALGELQKIMNSSLDVICTIDKDGNFISLSSAAEPIWGYTPEELAGRSYMELVYGEDHPKTIVAATNVMSGISLSVFENRYIHKNGSLVPVLWSAKWDEKEQIMYCIAKDATEKKRLEKAYENERQRYFDIFMNAPSSIVVLSGPDHIFQLANPLYLELIGKTNIIGKPVKEVLPEMVQQGFIEILDEVYSTGISFSANELLVKFDREGNGQLVDKYLNFTYAANKNSDGSVEGIFAFAIDVTEQVLSRKTIEESEIKYRQLIQDLPVALYTCDADGFLQLYNKAACKLWGREPEVGKEKWTGAYRMFDTDGSVLLPQDCPVAISLKNSTSIFDKEIIIERQDGTRRYATPIPIPQYNGEGRLTGAINMIVDITELNNINDKLRSSNERFEIVSKVTKDAIWDWDLATHDIYWSDSYESHFGYKADDKKSNFEQWYTAVHPDDVVRVNNGIIKSIKNKHQHWQDEYRFMKANGEIAYIFDRGYLIYDEEDKPVRMVGSMQDISHQKLSEKKLQEYQEQLLESQRIAHIGSWQFDFSSLADLETNNISCSEETYKFWDSLLVKVIFHTKCLFSLFIPRTGKWYRKHLKKL
jgi:PAS domain S-box-containing protein